jgi:hypothetical protein
VSNTRQTKMFIGAITLAAVSATAYAGFASHALHAYYALAVLTMATVTSRMKVKLPGINGNMSVNLPFLLTALVNLSALEAVLITCVSTVVQCWPDKGKFKPQQMAFNVSMMALAGCLAGMIFHASWLHGTHSGATATLGLAMATATLFIGQTAPVATIVALSEGKAAGQIWWSLAHLSFPYYVVSAGVTTMVQTISLHLGWGLALAAFPAMYGIHRSYRIYFTPLFAPLGETPRRQTMVRAAATGA